MENPYFLKGSKICVAVRKDEVMVYGNKQAFKSLVGWLEDISTADPELHYELHLPWHFKDQKNNEVKDGDFFFAHEESVFQAFADEKNEGKPDMQLSFMMVPEEDMKSIQEHKASGIIPDRPELD